MRALKIGADHRPQRIARSAGPSHVFERLDQPRDFGGIEDGGELIDRLRRWYLRRGHGTNTSGVQTLGSSNCAGVAFCGISRDFTPAAGRKSAQIAGEQRKLNLASRVLSGAILQSARAGDRTPVSPISSRVLFPLRYAGGCSRRSGVLSREARPLPPSRNRSKSSVRVPSAGRCRPLRMSPRELASLACFHSAYGAGGNGSLEHYVHAKREENRSRVRSSHRGNRHICSTVFPGRGKLPLRDGIVDLVLDAVERQAA